MTKEKRNFIRLTANIKVTYRILKKVRTRETLTKNIGGGGIKLFLSENLPVNTLLKLEIKIPKYPEPISAEGRIIWVERSKLRPKFNVGIGFTKITSVDRARIFKYVYEHIY